MKKLPINIVLVLLLSLVGGNSWGQQAPSLKTLFETLKSHKTYSFESQIKATFPDGTHEESKMVVCMDRPHKRLFYSNEDQTLLVTDKWIFQAYHGAKKASVFSVARYNKQYKKLLPEVESIFSEDLASFYIDSLMLRVVKLKSVKVNGDLATYDISFPDESIVKSMRIVYRLSAKLPETISIRTFEPTQAGYYDKSQAGISLETTCHKYKKEIPESFFDTNKYFRVSGSKVTLNLYKNYQLTTIL